VEILADQNKACRTVHGLAHTKLVWLLIFWKRLKAGNFFTSFRWDSGS